MMLPSATPHATDSCPGLSDPSICPEVEDRRICSRQECTLSATLICNEEGAISPCMATNIGEGGVRLSVPNGHRIAVGQRLEVFLYQDRPGEAPPDVLSEGQYATVVRTEAGGDGAGGTMGVAMCFDQPLFL